MKAPAKSTVQDLLPRSKRIGLGYDAETLSYLLLAELRQATRKALGYRANQTRKKS